MVSLLSRIWIVETISVLRLLAALAFAAIAFEDVPIVIPCGLYLTAATSDLLDGYLARKFKVVTFFGKVIDLVSDKSVTIVSLLYAAARRIDLLPLALIGTREIIMIGMRLVLLHGTELFPTNKILGGTMAAVLWGNTLLLFLAGQTEEIFKTANFIYWVCTIVLVGNLLLRIATNMQRIKISLGRGL